MKVAKERRLVGGHGLHGPAMQTVKGLGLQPLNEEVDRSEPLATGQRQQAGFDKITLVLLQHNRRLIENEAADVVEFRYAEHHRGILDSTLREADMKFLVDSRPFRTRRMISTPS